jgi:glycosyltransferase involved in cell wall biosynthesis
MTREMGGEFAILLPAYSHGVRNVRPGLSLHLANQALALRKVAQQARVKVYVAATSDEDTPGLWDRVRAAFAPDEIITLVDGRAALTRAATELLERHPRLLAHVQGTRQLQALVPARRRHGERLKIVYSVHSFRNATWLRWPYSWLLSHRLAGNVDYTLFFSPFAVSGFARAGRLLRAGRAGVMPLGADENLPAREPRRGELRPEIEAALMAPGRFSFVYLAAFKPGKGHEWLIEGAAPALRRHRNAQIILAGWGEEAVRRRVEAAAVRLDVAAQVIMPGPISRDLVPWLLARCHASLVPSRSETFGQCIVEPMVAGLPVVGTRKGVGEWLLMDYHTGIGIEYGDSRGLTRAIDYLLTHQSAAAEMGRNAAAAVRALLGWGDIAACHFRIYAAVMSSTQN